MKNAIFALALTVGAFVSMSQAQAAFPSESPIWACHLKATAVHDNRFYVFLRAGEINATGVMTCQAPFRKAVSSKVRVTIAELGLGIGFGFPVEKASLDILQLKAGVSTPEGVFGKYQLQAGPGLTLVAARISAEGDVAVTPGESVAAGVQIRVEQLLGLGLDFSGGVMTIERN